MPDSFSGLLKAMRAGIDRMVVGAAPAHTPQTGIDITAAIFFDGTGNNRNNVAQRHIAEYNRAHPNQPANNENGVRWTGSYKKYGKEDSYNAGYSNVSILENLNRNRELAQRQVSVYMEGIGTENNGGDALLGSAIGTGSTGIIPKVLTGIGLLADGIDKILKLDEDTYVKQVTIDVSGFSRGAAAARHFISYLHARRSLAMRLGIPKAKVKIKFVGIFDTVSSFSAIGFNNVDQLGLRILGNADKVVHLTAGDEFRSNFSLTDITSSLSIGYELTLPGAHSDIGGGYAETEDETRELHPAEQADLLAKGWYVATPQPEITMRQEDVYNPQTGQKMYTRRWPVGIRRALRHDYQFIPLGLMATCAREQGHMRLAALTPGGRYGRYALAGNHPLAPVQAAIQQQVRGHGASGRHVLRLPDDVRPSNGVPGVPLALNLGLVHLLRHRYLHRSAGISFGADGRIGMGERRENNKLHRLIYHG